MNAASRAPRIGVDCSSDRSGASPLLPLYREAVGLAPELDFYFLTAEPGTLRRDEPALRAPNVQWLEMPQRPVAWRLAWQLPRAQRALALDLLHVVDRLPYVGRGACACTLQALPGDRRTVRRAALLYADSRFARSTVAGQHRLAPERIGLTPQGVDAVRFRPGRDGGALVRALGLSPGGYLCTVGRVAPRKNLLGLLQAYALMPAPRPPLVIIGRCADGNPHGTAVHDTVQRLGLSADVRWLDQVSDTQLPALLRHAQLFVYPHLAPCRSQPVLEAMASGVAVVTGNGSVLPELVGTAGLMVDPCNAHELAAAMLCLLADPRRRETLVQRGLAQAARHHWRLSAEQLVDSLRGYLGRLDRPQPAWAL